MGEEPTDTSNISGDNDGNTVELVVDEMANNVAQQSEEESLKKEMEKKKELEKEKEH